jgi:hypothetical protein
VKRERERTAVVTGRVTRSRHNGDCPVSVARHSTEGLGEMRFVCWLGGREECDPRSREQAVSSQVVDLEIMVLLEGVEPDRLKGVCVSQSTRQNIDLVGMKGGPRDAEGLRHSRVVCGSWRTGGVT